MSKKALSLFTALVVSVLFSGWNYSFAQEKVTFSLDWIPYGRDAGFYGAKSQGYFRAANLSVNFLAGKGSSNSIKRLGLGTAHFAVPDTGTIVVARSKGAKVKLVGIYHDESMMTVIHVEGSGISRVTDLSGRVLGDAIWGAAHAIFPVLAAKNGLDPKAVKWSIMSPAAKGPSLIAGKVDAITAYVTDFLAYEKGATQVGKQLLQMKFADNGVDLYGNGVATTDQRLKENPALVRRFTKALYQGVAWAVENPDKAVSYFLSQVPIGNRELTKRQWALTVDHLMTPIAKEKGIGFIKRSKLKYTRDAIAKARKIKGDVAVDDLYTDKYFPKLFPKKP